jgi:hypothetical protein
LTPSDIAALRDLKATALLRLPIQKLRAYAAAIGVTNSRGDSDQAAIAGIPRAALVRAINTARERGARRGSVDDLAASWAVADDALLIGATTPNLNGGDFIFPFNRMTEYFTNLMSFNAIISNNCYARQW